MRVLRLVFFLFIIQIRALRDKTECSIRRDGVRSVDRRDIYDTLMCLFIAHVLRVR